MKQQQRQMDRGHSGHSDLSHMNHGSMEGMPGRPAPFSFAQRPQSQLIQFFQLGDCH